MFRGGFGAGLLILSSALPALSLGAGLPELSQVPLGGDSRILEKLRDDRSQLEARKDKLKSDIAVNKAKCGNVEEGSGLERECQKEDKRIKDQFAALLADYQDFNKRARSAKKTVGSGALMEGSKKSSTEPYIPPGPSGRVVESKGDFYFITKDGRKIEGAQAANVPLEAGTRLRTGPNGGLKLLLPDETTFTIGADSDLVMDEFVYDTRSTPGIFAARIAKGAFHWVTGKIAHRTGNKMELKFGVDAVGIRGTEFDLWVNQDQSGYIKLYSGKLDITERTVPKLLLKGGQRVDFGVDGRFEKPVALDQ